MALTLNAASSGSIPAHVPSHLAFDFDMYVLPEQYGSDPHAYWKAVQDSYPDIFWTPAYGGHWVALRGEDIKTIQSDFEQFSNAGAFIPKGLSPVLIPEHLDPPEHTPFRKLIMPYFLPNALKELEEKARRIAIDIIEELRPQGGCEFVTDFSSVMPVLAFLHLAGLPEEDMPMLKGWGKLMSPANNPRAPEGWAKFVAYVTEWIERCKTEPRPGLINAIAHAEVNGQPLTDEQRISMATLAVSGGLDTVMLMTSFTAHHLAKHPEDRKYLREHPEKIADAVEEFGRRFGTSNLSRDIRADLVYKGIEMKKGEQVMMPFPLYGLDDRIYERPMEVDFNRPSFRHTSFGTGPHTCPGAMLARREITIFLQEWLTRIPEFRVKPGTAPVCGVGLINTIGNLQLEWDI
jgi:cytochrome P450